MTDDPLYRRDLLRLAADACGAGRLPDADALGSAHNPACGDRITIELALADGRITALAHVTQACVLTQASAGLLASLAPGQDRSTIAGLADKVRAFLGGAPPPPGYDVFDGVAGHAGRHVCVLLPFAAALTALDAAEKDAERSQGQPRP